MINIYDSFDNLTTGIKLQQLGFDQHEWDELSQEEKESEIAGFIENEGCAKYGWSWEEVLNES